MSKTILITGASDGIGLETAKALLADGHHLLLHGRTAEKLQSVVESLPQFADQIEQYIADLSVMGEVRMLVAAIKQKHDSLDILINNAGVFKTPTTRTQDGFDTRLAVNTIAPYLLTRELLPLLNSQSRVVNLSSAAQAEVSMDGLTGKTPYNNDMSAYAQSKRAITLWTHQLAITLEQSPVLIAVNPGSLLASKMVKEGFGVAGNDLSIGVNIIKRAALSSGFGEANGKYFDNDAETFSAIGGLDQAPQVVKILDQLITLPC
ncbi:2-(R)-hydroxypropyl-CoM dehydrogenase [BD1-7 clade bacterium]|uniref:2-(R)-hydroxypropyl-CoM dehydrogenase n=1 Tax=BD1-7 clade bacterium TaxID=2029982 RepID=A0A5S9QTF0_9GAMM|nr:2-(R)-hydroxypropyl-CoM dehydrogenase [BD1-7 clade bacterium]